MRLGVGLLKKVEAQNKPWVAIVDHSINIGIKKVFVVLRVSADTLLKNSAITLSDCECIGIKVSKKVNANSIAKELKDIFEKSGDPVAIIKDGDHTLNRGVIDYIQHHNRDIEIIDDIGHLTANALKKQFEKSKGYKKFMKLLRDGATYLRQTDIAFIMPPKLRKKGRFQSVVKLGDWSMKVMDIFSTKGRAKKGTLLYRLRKTMPEFISLKPFLKNFAKTTRLSSEFMKVLKNRGLNESTYKECKDILTKFPKNSKTRKILRIWLQKHTRIQQTLNIKSLPVSSDIIESLFGKFKIITKRNPQADMNRQVLVIPTLCGDINESVILESFNNASHYDLKEWDRINTPDTIRKSRMEFFNNIQNMGNLVCAG